MPYISRDRKGVIIELHQSPPSEVSTWLEMNDPEVVKFLQHIETLDRAKWVLSNTDFEMVGVRV